MLEVKVKRDKNIFKSPLFDVVKIKGASIKITTNPFAKKYTRKEELSMFLLINDKPYQLSEKKEYKVDTLVRAKHTLINKNFTEKDIVKMRFDMECADDLEDFRKSQCFYYIPKFNNDVSFNLVNRKDIRFIKEIQDKNLRMEILESDYLYFIKPNDNMTNFGTFLKRDSFFETSREDFLEKVLNGEIDIERNSKEDR